MIKYQCLVFQWLSERGRDMILSLIKVRDPPYLRSFEHSYKVFDPLEKSIIWPRRNMRMNKNKVTLMFRHAIEIFYSEEDE